MSSNPVGISSRARLSAAGRQSTWAASAKRHSQGVEHHICGGGSAAGKLSKNSIVHASMLHPATYNQKRAKTERNIHIFLDFHQPLQAIMHQLSPRLK
jgi:hypothetical protein